MTGTKMGALSLLLDRTHRVWYYGVSPGETTLAKRKRYEDYMLLAPKEQVPGHNSHYQVERIIGTGAFGAVYFATNSAFPGRRVALKEFFPARHPREQENLHDLFDRERTVGMHRPAQGR